MVGVGDFEMISGPADGGYGCWGDQTFGVQSPAQVCVDGYQAVSFIGRDVGLEFRGRIAFCFR